MNWYLARRETERNRWPSSTESSRTKTSGGRMTTFVVGNMHAFEAAAGSRSNVCGGRTSVYPTFGPDGRYSGRFIQLRCLLEGAAPRPTIVTHLAGHPREKPRCGSCEATNGSANGNARAAHGSAEAHAGRPPRLDPARWTLLHPLLEGRGWTFVRVCSDALALTLTIALAAGAGAIIDPAAPGTQLLWAYPVLTIALLGLRGLYRADHYLSLIHI